ncbi:hypothetical protein KEM55_001699, partial [Ascosphaera atra]
MGPLSQHGPGGHWSAKNPVPSIGKFLENVSKHNKEKEEEDAERAQKQAEQDEEKEEKKQRQEKSGTEEDTGPSGGRAAERMTAGDTGGGEDESEDHPAIQPRRVGRKVTDPTTGREVEIDDVDKQFMKAVKKPIAAQSSPDQNLDEYKENQDITAPPDPVASGTTSDVPIHGEKTNILFHPTPSITYEGFFKQLEKRANFACGGIFAAIIIVGRLAGGSLKYLFPLAFGIASAVFLWMVELIKQGRAGEWANEKLRGRTAIANLLPESVEWMNSFLEIGWGLLDPDVFATVADTIEDVMQTSLPGFIENVRVAEIDQGSNPFRILSMRALPDGHVEDLSKGAKKHVEETKPQSEVEADRNMGAYYNLEASFAYHATPSGQSTESKAANMHMLLYFYLGVKGLFGIPLPVFVELIEAVGTVRLRLQMTPDPPFVKLLTFSLMGLPHLRAGCTPMLKQGINILRLPVISNFVNYAIATAASLYVAPKSMSLDLRMLLQGDDIEKDTEALGVLWVRIHRAKDLSKQDARGSVGGGSDPYINISFSKYGKPMYCTRVIMDDRNPVWEESTALLVDPELIRANEQLSIELWDSDRTTADDIVGKVELPMQRMIEKPGRMFNVTSTLKGMNEGSEMPGSLEWEVGYFGKTRFRESMRTDGKNPNLPESLKDHPALQDDKGKLTSKEADDVVHTPPDPLWPSGICSVIVHQINNLELAEIKGTYRGRKKHEYDPARKYGENREERGKNLPTSYCTIHINDFLAYRTRAKAVSSKPIFNAGTERFIRDWKSAIITVTVRDQRFRQHDPILGVIPLKLSDILQTSSQATRWYPLAGGIGYGRVRISLLFRSVETRLPRNVLGWDVGTFQLCSDTVKADGYNDSAKLRIRTSGCETSIGRTSCHSLEEGEGRYWQVPEGEERESVFLPIKHRHRTPIVFEIGGSPTAYAILWLQDYPDNEEIDADLALWHCKMHTRLTQNYITEKNYEEKKVPGLEDLREIGRLRFRFRFAAGLHQIFRKHINDNESRETFETWEACIAEGLRDREVSDELPETIKQLYENSLLQSRDIISQASDKEQKEWLNDTGIDKNAILDGDRQAMEDAQRLKGSHSFNENR